MQTNNAGNAKGKITSMILIALASLIMIFALSAPFASANELWEYSFKPFDNYAPAGKMSGMQLMQFYPVEDWEVEVCTRDITSMKDRSDDRAQNPQSPRLWYDGSTIAISASKYTYKGDNETLYNIEWYVQPRGSALRYSLYLKDAAGVTFQIPEYKDVDVENGAVSSGVMPKYYGANYTIAGISFTDSLGSAQKMEATIVADTRPSYG